MQIRTRHLWLWTGPSMKRVFPGSRWNWSFYLVLWPRPGTTPTGFLIEGFHFEFWADWVDIEIWWKRVRYG